MFFCKESGHRIAQCQKHNGQRRRHLQVFSYQRERDCCVPRGTACAVVANHRAHVYEEMEPELKIEFVEQLTSIAAVIREMAGEDNNNRFHQRLIEIGYGE